MLKPCKAWRPMRSGPWSKYSRAFTRICRQPSTLTLRKVCDELIVRRTLQVACHQCFTRTIFGRGRNTKYRPEASCAGAVVSILEESFHGLDIEFQRAPIRIARRNRRVVQFN